MNVWLIHFNHDVTSASSDALMIRKNVTGTPIQAPEWRDGYAPEPVAYAAAALGATVTIRARFSGGPANEAATIRAIDAYVPPVEPAGCLGWFLYLFVVLIRAIFGNVLGNAEARSVSFDASGKSGLETFNLLNHKLRTCGVGIRTTDWKWQVRGRSKWTTFGTTQHRLYVVLDIPSGPWSQSSAGNDTQLPWTDALDKACTWALGAKTKDEAAASITKAVNTQSLQSYTPVTIFGGWGSYALSSYLNQLNGGIPFSLNRTDCAAAVTTLANVLGCDLWEGRFFNMMTRPFLTLNGNPAVQADWVKWTWGYHEICWLRVIGTNELICDGCLQVDVDNNYADLVHVPQHPVKMPFNDYKFRLIESGPGTLENIPRRRAVS